MIQNALIRLGVVDDASLVLGGVASIPWRLSQVESALRGKPLDDLTIEEIAEMSATDARPLRNNAYKVALIRGIVREALSKLRASTLT